MLQAIRIQCGFVYKPLPAASCLRYCLPAAGYPRNCQLSSLLPGASATASLLLSTLAATLAVALATPESRYAGPPHSSEDNSEGSNEAVVKVP